MDFVKKNIKYIGVAGCALVAIGNFLPFATVTASMFGVSASESVNFISGDGKFVFALAILAALLILGKQLSSKINFFNRDLFDKLFNYWWGAIVPLGIALAITIYDAANVNDVTGGYSYAGVDVSFGIGFYIILVGMVAGIGSVLFEKFVMKNDVTTVNNNVQAQMQPAMASNVNAQPQMNNGNVQNKFCSSCGAQIPSDTKFCTNCGKQVQ